MRTSSTKISDLQLWNDRLIRVKRCEELEILAYWYFDLAAQQRTMLAGEDSVGQLKGQLTSRCSVR